MNMPKIPVKIIDEGKPEMVLVEDTAGTPKTLREAISSAPFLVCLADSDTYEAERITNQIHRVIKDFLAQKFGRAYLESTDSDAEALKILFSEVTK